MKKLSLINETHWGGMVRRSSSEVKREEDKHRFDEAFKAIKDADDQFFEIKTHKISSNNFYTDDVLWAPFNFGSKYTNEPGYFMDENDLKELDEYLKDTNYEIPNAGDWYNLVNSYNFTITKAGKYWSLFKAEDGKQFYLPQFGYISGASVDDEVSGLLKSDRLYYVFKYDKGFGYECIKKMGGQPENTTYLFEDDVDDKIQVRLIKRHK